MLTVALARPIWAIGETFTPRTKAGSTANRWPVVRATVLAWGLTCVAAGVWVAIVLGNDKHLARSLTEGGFVVAAVLGTIVIVIAGLRASRSRQSGR